MWSSPHYFKERFSALIKNLGDKFVPLFPENVTYENEPAENRIKTYNSLLLLFRQNWAWHYWNNEDGYSNYLIWIVNL